ncbi:protein of unknown function [Taphrina deformans PYCC 5710]|uniref:Uncharacterized protein n=1 Tax=Taphrina deformans (strain PYCC 5710 / ATCC 11124 / CBS 356.35 / IMI 108563 / JCM 9778 / NBRC 8474) TaxID=1097556 RepID=R4XC09_TAPDE|nr:protein of unknown function [Taphrina deformans PYCC 5710]|eukprot:CCG83095.1 protein of unknown function [Taphrina deformans PYCC 5710]
MRPPQSPDRSKYQNGGSKNNWSKPDQSLAPQIPPYQSQNQNQHQHNPYPSHHAPPPPSIPAINQNHGTPSGPVPGANLAPMLGRTSPVTEIKPLASRDDLNAPREQPPTPAPLHHQQHNGRHSRPITPAPSSRDSEPSTLKRPREHDESSVAPEAKKQELSSAKPQHDDRQRGDSDRSSHGTPRRDVEPRPAARSENNHENVAAEQINGRLVKEGENADDRSASRSAREKEDGPAREQQQQQQQAPQQQLPQAQNPQTQPQATKEEASESAERKVELDEDYDDEEEAPKPTVAEKQ